MRRFTELFHELDRTTRINAKVAALAHYFADVDDASRIWAIALLSGRTPRRAVTATQLRTWAAAEAGIPLWLFEDAYAVVGDLAETIALVLPSAGTLSAHDLAWWMSEIRGLERLDEAGRRARIVAAWRELPPDQRFIFNKLITGGFRIGVSQKLVTRALAVATGIDEPLLAQRLMGNWTPLDTSYEALIAASESEARSTPYPFLLAYALEGDPSSLGAESDWLAEYKWDGIRAQLVVRGGRPFIWSRGEELVTDRFPEIALLADFLEDGTVIDGEILPWRDGAPLPFQALQRRIGRKTVSRKQLADTPARLVAYDLLEQRGVDLREVAFAERRQQLEALAAALPRDVGFDVSPLIDFAGWDALAEARTGAVARGAEGVMIKRRDSLYRGGRRKGDWWKWKVEPLSVDAVLVYAQAGHGRRANLYTDFTFAVRGDDGELVPFAKAYSGLTDQELARVTSWVRRNTLERFGPVRRVTPELVFEIAFEGIQASTRHKSGIAVRFPRIVRWRHDKPAAEADTLADLIALLSARSAAA